MSLQSLNTKRFTEIVATCFIFMQTEDRKGNWAKHPGPLLPVSLRTSLIKPIIHDLKGLQIAAAASYIILKKGCFESKR